MVNLLLPYQYISHDPLQKVYFPLSIIFKYPSTLLLPFVNIKKLKEL